MKNWEKQFDKQILQRGKEYYEQGAVEAMGEWFDGYVAFVQGTETYQVNLEVSGDEIVDMTCSCPYAEEGNHCKHMAAVLYRMEANKTLVKGKLVQKKEDPDAIIDKMSKKELKECLKDLVNSSPSVKKKFLQSYGSGFSEQKFLNMKEEIRQVIRKYKRNYGMVEEDYVEGFVYSLNDYVFRSINDLKRMGKNREAAELILDLFDSLGELEIEDSEADFAEFIDGVLYEMEQILNRSKAEEKEKILAMVKEFLAHNSGEHNYMLEDYFDYYLSEEE